MRVASSYGGLSEIFYIYDGIYDGIENNLYML